MAAVPHLKDGYSSGFVATTKDPPLTKDRRGWSFAPWVESLFYSLTVLTARLMSPPLKQRGTSTHRTKFHMPNKAIILKFFSFLSSSLRGFSSSQMYVYIYLSPFFFLMSLRNLSTMRRATYAKIFTHFSFQIKSVNLLVIRDISYCFVFIIKYWPYTTFAENIVCIYDNVLITI